MKMQSKHTIKLILDQVLLELLFNYSELDNSNYCAIKA